MLCPTCKRGELRRVHRKGFYQEQVAPLLGKFPWECPLCREVSMKKVRLVARSKRQAGPPQTT